MKAYVLIDVQMGKINEVLNHLRRAEQIKEATMTFGPYDAVAVVEISDLVEMGRLLSTVIQPIPGVIETLTCLAAEG